MRELKRRRRRFKWDSSNGWWRTRSPKQTKLFSNTCKQILNQRWINSKVKRNRIGHFMKSWFAVLITIWMGVWVGAANLRLITHYHPKLMTLFWQQQPQPGTRNQKQKDCANERNVLKQEEEISWRQKCSVYRLLLLLCKNYSDLVPVLGSSFTCCCCCCCCPEWQLCDTKH